MLENRRGANIAKGASGAANGGVNIFPTVNFRRNKNIADALAGKGKRLAVRIAYHRVAVIFCYEGNLNPVIDNLAVGLVRNEKNPFSKAALRFRKNLRKAYDAFFRKHRARGVVRRIYDDGRGFFVKSAFKALKINLKILLSAGNGNGLSAGGFNINPVFGKTGGENYYLAALLHKRGERNGKACRRAAGKIEVLRAEIRSKAAVKVVGNGTSCGGAARGGGITVNFNRVPLGQKAHKLFLHRLGHGRVWVANAEIKDVFVADFRLSFVAVFKKLPYYGAFFAQGFHSFSVHQSAS